MKRKKCVWQPIVIGGTLICMLGQNVFAKESGEEKSYTYTVTLYAGNQGILSEETGINVDNHLTGSKYQINSVEKQGEKLRITGLQYGDVVSVSASSVVKMKQDSPYYVKGVRESGRDNGTVGASAFSVKEDKEYVVAYGIKGNMVSYTVNYQDTQGKILAESQKFYGVVGEQPVVAFRYIENYQPQAYNLTKTLSKNETENVFTFVYQENSNEISVNEERDSISSESSQGESQSESRRNRRGTETQETEPVQEGGRENETENTQTGVNGNERENLQTDAERNTEENEQGNAISDNEMESAQDSEKEEIKDIMNLDEEATSQKEKQVNEKENPKKNIPVYLGAGAATTGGIGAISYGMIRRKKGKVKKG